MFNWIKKQVEDFRVSYQENRIKADFSGYMESRRGEHWQLALQRFPTGELEKELSHQLKAAHEEARLLYGEEMSQLERDVSVISSQIEQCVVSLAVFAPDYEALIKPLKEEARRLNGRKKELHIQKDKAYADAESAKGSLDSWYAKSERSGWLLGNSGKSLPQHSVFGQSLNDRDGYKLDLSRAGDCIQATKREIGAVKARLEQIGIQIGELQAKREHVAELRRQGKSPEKIQRTIDAMRRQQEQFRARLSVVSSKRAKMLEEEKLRLGVAPIEKRILEVKLQRDDFYRSFDSPEHQAILRANHREQWFSAHGR